MGKPAQQRRSRERMTRYNIAKANKILQGKQNQIGVLKSEIFTLKEANLKLETELKNVKIENSILKEDNVKSKTELVNFKLECSQKMTEALLSQKNYLFEKHVKILENYSEDLKEKYRKQFNESSKAFQSETLKLKTQIKLLLHDLEVSKQALLSSAMRKPVYSPGKYCDNG